MSRMLRHIPTGDLYIFTSILAKRPDMEMVPEVEEPAPVEEVAAAAEELPVEEKPVIEKKAGPKKKKEVQSAETLSIDIEE